MKYSKYYKLIKDMAREFDVSQNCKIGQTWQYHIQPVINNALLLADRYGADKDIVEVASLFHDIADLVDYGNRGQHHILGAEMTAKILKEDGFDEEFISRVEKCILHHRASVYKDKYSIEEICVADADAMAHLDSVVELICWRAYLGEDIATCNAFVKQKISKSFAKMSTETKALMQDKYDSIMRVLLE